MSDTVKLNLNRIAVVLVIVVTLASAVGGGYITYDNAKCTKSDLRDFKRVQEARNDEADRRVAELEKKQARFEGRMDERTANTLKRVDDIYDIVKEWEKN